MLELKEQLHDQSVTPLQPLQMRLIYGGRVLADELTLHHYGNPASLFGYSLGSWFPFPVPLSVSLCPGRT